MLTEVQETAAHIQVNMCPVLEAFDMLLMEHDILSLPHFSCCTSCGRQAAEEQALENDNIGFAFFTVQDTDQALDSHKLYIGFGGLEAPDILVGRMLQECLQEFELLTTWDGTDRTRLAVELTDDDVQWLQDLCDHDFEDMYEDDIQAARLKRAWRELKHGIDSAMDEKESLADSFTAWSLLPGGPAFKRVRHSFLTSQLI